MLRLQSAEQSLPQLTTEAEANAGLMEAHARECRWYSASCPCTFAGSNCTCSVPPEVFGRESGTNVRSRIAGVGWAGTSTLWRRCGIGLQCS